MGLSELRKLEKLREEDSRFKRVVADLSLDRYILREIVSKTEKPRQNRSKTWAEEPASLGG